MTDCAWCSSIQICTTTNDAYHKTCESAWRVSKCDKRLGLWDVYWQYLLAAGLLGFIIISILFGLVAKCYLDRRQGTLVSHDLNLYLFAVKYGSLNEKRIENPMEENDSAIESFAATQTKRKAEDISEMTAEEQKKAMQEVIRRKIKASPDAVQQTSNGSSTDNQIPPQPKDADGARIWQRLKDFVDDTTLTRFDFPADSTSKERKIAHPLADAFGLLHYSRGSKVRVLTIEKKSHVKDDEWQWFFNYIGVFGPKVDKVAEDVTDDVVSQDHRGKKKRRDGPINHITFLSPGEPQQLLDKLSKLCETFGMERGEEPEREKLMDVISKNITDDWVDLGVGQLTQGEQKVWYKVIRWPSADDFRAKVGLPKKDFHVTLGYTHFDIHNQTKDENTLITHKNE
ncbi:hypothetical protein PROFUN_03180 [Planoprotostelium fungivorum]|uniref:R3H domain-containing protein n=1 Tax=Planoprotostelium fungivorum TaxID=1890364 RepID=A0A2P6NWX7_9EUKA|nr:hypothetical protein PROFUN_03180 [Planoprotostelium fungivorum]